MVVVNKKLETIHADLAKLLRLFNKNGCLSTLKQIQRELLKIPYFRKRKFIKISQVIQTDPRFIHFIGKIHSQQKPPSVKFNSYL